MIIITHARHSLTPRRNHIRPRSQLSFTTAFPAARNRERTDRSSSGRTTATCFLFFLHKHLLSSFWTSRGPRCRPFFPQVVAFNFLSRIGFSNPTARRFLIECCC